ncbi:MAG TPA: DUF1553 domain-containing protein, partial [Pirellulales bacterium]|nr:DUF1553 domain-containing protein [Pirellulales bacterium]
FVLKEPIALAGPAQLTVVLKQLHGGGHLIGRPRLAITSAPQPTAAAPMSPEITAALALSPDARTAEQRSELTRFLLAWDASHDLGQLPPAQFIYAVANRATSNGVPVMPPAQPRPVHVLNRGDVNQPLAEAVPGTISCIDGLAGRFTLENPADEASRRAALARWLAASQNVLTWRSIANRIWHYHFGRGIVDTPNDLGVMGGQPSHPELLDYLAVELRDGGGSLKALHRLIVTSATYRQLSQTDPAQAQADAENRLLWRMNRTRLDAETMRDSLLQASGKLDLAMGGPSVKQFIESPGIHVTPNVDYASYDLDAPGNFRRSIYRFLFRTLPDPLMESLDCPDGAQLAPSRAESLTALQALTMLDNRQVVRLSEHTAARLTHAAPELAAQVRLLFQLALLRDAVPAESERWQAYAARHGLANACRMMFNTNEFMFVD